MSERTDKLIGRCVNAAITALKTEIERMERVVDAAIAYHVVNKDMHIDLNDPMAIPEMQRRFVECNENLHAAVREYQEQERKE